MLKNIRIVLVDTSHPGNIGAAARAMKNMSLRQLHLVTPQHYPHQEATSRASGADDLLNNARVAGSLDEALTGCRLVVGTSARTRSIDWPIVTPREAAAKLVQEARSGDVALVFGRERSGLTNSELDRCTFLVHIPTNEDYSSLNLGAAVQILAYEIYLAQQQDPTVKSDSQRDLATADMLQGFHEHLAQALDDIGFTDPRQSQKLLRRLRSLFQRARPDKDEINIMRGILSAMQGRKSMRR
ncbi:MAG: RNA methyltransferase [Candidatus Thiodiazotropha sp. (ex Lucina aurantia)]|uniref:tRNA (cytidine/uridine-2'-O-)-methyltransferase TrmJ n=2 Tax=Candidatus Thiodiazotropha TaxID=1913444 RepID=A0A7Z0VQN1_9GAMM|nr:RNA methyltransferase [Candidatus Thiodiazotropha endolucinida]MBT3012368.1 RNA methyltransferase [Candidatus Thiodiazotropha sp. (ex Lucina pensylvanica)]MBT3017267.1 RNA methyltransferase [Candidatus Thiodiazotropha taylori]MBT3038777.1 RNA methyltransferase [Candidatus Thiodiazotropha sp. (ex Codakia orbicularis)]MBV2102751.1 RNA methyltransferase [Candidatus Thiodiazotropha sp. (ex Lucina aurantia)]MBT3022919.1 RNA methyltransferase [Candidatus Thiodiazotropha taylori]